MKADHHGFRCTIHDVEFKAERHKDFATVECPYCMAEKNKLTLSLLREATDHRDALLRAIHIKQTVEPLHA